MLRQALIIGINDYPYLSNLKTPARDAEQIAQLLERHGGFRVTRLPVTAQNTALQVDAKPRPEQLVKLADLKTAIAQLFNPQGNDVPDTALLYFAGHGLREVCGGIAEGYLATTDANPKKGLRGLPLNWLQRLLQSSSVREQIIWLDCCYSGELLNGKFINFEEADPGERGQGRDRCFIAACNDAQVAYGSEEHGVLTSVLLQGLNPEQYPVGQWIDNLMLAAFINQQLETDPILRTFPQRPLFNNAGGAIKLIQGTKTVVVEAVNSPQADICPYKGLEAFDFNEDDPKYFYGRTALVSELIEKVRQGNFLAVLGSSGSGKSSVVRAGLLYQLKLGQRLSGSHQWKILPIIRPGKQPLQSLAAAFVTTEESEKRAERLRKTYERELRIQGAAGLRELVAEFDAPTVVLVVDQFEEVFTLCQDVEERQSFFDCLLGAVEDSDQVETADLPSLKVAIAMRADFLGECAEYARLAKHIQQHLVTVTPMTTEELTQAITEPAKQVGLDVEASLVIEMIGEVRNSPGSLPLLQFALRELWEKRDRENRQLTRSQYEAMGGVIGALNRHAQQVYRYKDYSLASPTQEREPQEQEWIKRIFLKLVRTGEGIKDTRQPQPRAKLLAIAGDDAEQQEVLSEVLDELVQGRLLVTGGEEQPSGEHSELALTNQAKADQIVDLAHEALMEGWEEFAKWRETKRQLLRLRDRLEDALREWDREGKKNEDLIKGSLLAQVRENWQDLESELDVTGKEFYYLSDVYEQEQFSSQERLRRKLRETQAKLEELSRQRTQLEQQKAGYLATLQRFEQRMGNSRRTAEWLKENQEELIETATLAALDAGSSLTKAGGTLDSPDKVQRFRWDIDDYIDWLRTSLELGAIIPLEETDLTPTLSNSRISYVAAFNFIKERAERELSNGVAEELEVVLSYLINYFSPASSEQASD
jgi:energy-coupling factor transporter ATP-binding protein EcfA2